MRISFKHTRFSFWVSIFMLMLMIEGSFAAQNLGHVQIKCEPGVNIYLNGNYCNQTNEDVGGLIIQDLPTGKHGIKAVKDGCQPIEQDINLSAGQVLMLEFPSFIPRIGTYEEGEESETKIAIQTGKIVIQSLPLECSINIPSLDIFGLKKNKDKRVLDKVPTGTYLIEFIGMGKTLSHTIQLKGNDTVNLMVNFLKEEVKEEREFGNRPSNPTPVLTPRTKPETRKQTAPPITPQPVSETPHIPAGNKGNVLFSDTFSGKDKTRPAHWKIYHTTSSEYWHIFEQQFSTGNGDNITGKNGNTWAVIDIPGSENWANYSIQTSFWVRQSNGKAFILGRYKDNNNFYAGVFETYQGDRYLRIHKIVNGTWSILASLKNNKNRMTLPAMEDGTSPENSQIMIFTLAGSKLRLSIGDKAFVETEDHTFKQGTCGLGEWYHYILFDNFSVKAIEAPGTDISSPPGKGRQYQPVSNQWNPLPAPPSY